MAGIIMPLVIPRETYKFFNLQASSPLAFYVVKNLDVSQYREIDLLVRVHSSIINQPDASIAVGLWADAPTPEDPIFESPVHVPSDITIDSTIVAPALLLRSYTVSLNPPPGMSIRLKVTANQGAIVDFLTATISADLVLKS